MDIRIGEEDFEAGVFGENLHVVMKCLPSGPGIQEREIRSLSGVETKQLNFALPKLVELGYLRVKDINGTRYYQKRPKDPPQEWFTIDEAGNFLRLSGRTIYQLVHDGQLAAYRVGTGGHRRFRRYDLERLMIPEDFESDDAMTAAADPVLAELWDNEKDAAYDSL